MASVSVVIPLYNGGHRITRALRSVLDQTCQDFEVIIVDDGSTDGGSDVVGGFPDPRIRLIRQENRGVAAARNRGIEEADSDVVAFLDADDEYLPGFLETIERLRRSYPNAGLYGTAYRVQFPGSVVERTYHPERGDQLIDSLFSAIVDLGGDLFNSSSFAAPKEVLLYKEGFPVGLVWNEDGVLFGKIALEYSVAYSPEIRSIYHKYAGAGQSNIVHYMSSPFLDYLTTLPIDCLEERDDLADIREYSDLCRLSAISRNIYNGFGARARQDLALVSSRRYRMKKAKLWLLTFVPPCVVSVARRYEVAFSFVKRKMIQT